MTHLPRHVTRTVLGGSVGFFLCVLIAQWAVDSLGEGSYRGVTPLLVLPLVAVAAAVLGKVGAWAGVFGAAVVFSRYLFDPLSKWDAVDRFAAFSVGWMVLSGILLPFLFGKSDPDERKRGLNRNSR